VEILSHKFAINIHRKYVLTCRKMRDTQQSRYRKKNLPFIAVKHILQSCILHTSEPSLNSAVPREHLLPAWHVHSVLLLFYVAPNH